MHTAIKKVTTQERTRATEHPRLRQNGLVVMTVSS
jgi:hypothetical protein